MAKLPRSGVAYQCLNECECTLPEIMVSLGLKPLSKSAERKLRDQLGFALAQWEEPYTAVEVEDVVSSLNAHAKRLDKLAPLAAVAKGGFCRSDEIEVACRLAQILSEDPTIGRIEAAYAYLEDFWNRAGVIAAACRSAATRLEATVGKDGHPRYDWYDGFTAVLIDVCQQNGIEPKVGIDRISGKPVGRLVEIAPVFERLILPKMRSPTPQALVKRLQRSRKRLEKRSTGSRFPLRASRPQLP
jgi:hypothetical protein